MVESKDHVINRDPVSCHCVCQYMEKIWGYTMRTWTRFAFCVHHRMHNAAPLCTHKGSYVLFLFLQVTKDTNLPHTPPPMALITYKKDGHHFSYWITIGGSGHPGNALPTRAIQISHIWCTHRRLETQLQLQITPKEIRASGSCTHRPLTLIIMVVDMAMCNTHMHTLINVMYYREQRTDGQTDGVSLKQTVVGKN